MKITIEKSLNHRQAFEEEINTNKKADERYFRFFVCIFLVNTYEIVNFGSLSNDVGKEKS
ncbi:hypothetical protein DPW26_02890 [Enterococcus faecium]|nr:hypothetical protein CRN11_05730 [Enterococcus faecium]RAU64627.1 hypothetical protein DPW25_04880 [Enterococcus faecium]RAU67152.1 hypothetical protein DPW26_02890 [Enterococcus faecium]